MTEQEREQDRGPGARKAELENRLDNNAEVEKQGNPQQDGNTEPYRGGDEDSAQS